jgi:hypothetical protein
MASADCLSESGILCQYPRGSYCMINSYQGFYISYSFFFHWVQSSQKSFLILLANVKRNESDKDKWANALEKLANTVFVKEKLPGAIPNNSIQCMMHPNF